MLLIIEIDAARVEIHDSKLYPEENYQSLLDVLKRYFQWLSHYIGLFCLFLEISSNYIYNTSFLAGQGLDFFEKEEAGT